MNTYKFNMKLSYDKDDTNEEKEEKLEQTVIFLTKVFSSVPVPKRKDIKLKYEEKTQNYKDMNQIRNILNKKEELHITYSGTLITNKNYLPYEN